VFICNSLVCAWHPALSRYVYVERKKQVSASDNGMSPEIPNALVTYAAQRQHWCVFARAHATLLAN